MATFTNSDIVRGTIFSEPMGATYVVTAKNEYTYNKTWYFTNMRTFITQKYTNKVDLVHKLNSEGFIKVEQVKIVAVGSG